MYKGASFVDLLILFSIAGSYFGAGYVGWRIAVKYYYCYDNRYIKYYMRYSLLSFVLLIVIIYTPLSFLGLLWSVIAPLCVLQSLSKIKKSHTHSH